MLTFCSVVGNNSHMWSSTLLMWSLIHLLNFSLWKKLGCFGLRKFLPYYTLISLMESFYFYFFIQGYVFRLFNFPLWEFFIWFTGFPGLNAGYSNQCESHRCYKTMRLYFHWNCLLWKSASCPTPAEEPRSLQREHALSSSPLRITEYKQRWECSINVDALELYKDSRDFFIKGPY